MKIKIIYIVSTLGRSGPTNQLYNIIKNLDINTFYPKILTLSPEPKDTMKKLFEDLGVEIETLGLGRIEGLFRIKKRVKKIVDEFNPHIIHTQGLRPDIIAANYLINYKRVNTLRNFPYDDYVMKFGKYKGSLMAYSHIKAIKKIPINIACSKSLSRMFKERIGLNIDFIQNGVNRDYFRADNNSKTLLREKLNLNKEGKYFITVGSLIERKDPLTIIKAFKEIQKAFLIVIGDGPLMSKCKEISSDNVIFIGQTNKVRDYLCASDYFISSSLSEGLPNTVLEAMSCGLPVILSDIEQHREILENDTSAGLFFNCRNVNQLIEKIEEIETKNYKLMRQRCINLIDNYFNAKIMSKKYQELYKSMVN